VDQYGPDCGSGDAIQSGKFLLLKREVAQIDQLPDVAVITSLRHSLI